MSSRITDNQKLSSTLCLHLSIWSDLILHWSSDVVWKSFVFISLHPQTRVLLRFQLCIFQSHGGIFIGFINCMVQSYIGLPYFIIFYLIALCFWSLRTKNGYGLWVLRELRGLCWQWQAFRMGIHRWRLLHDLWHLLKTVNRINHPTCFPSPETKTGKKTSSSSTI